MRETLRGALLSVLFFGLLVGNGPAMASNDDPEDWGLGEVLEVIGEYVPVPRMKIFTPPPNPESMGAEFFQSMEESAREAIYQSVKRILRGLADQAGHTPERVCSWYGENYRSKGASAVRIGIALAALVYMYWDLRDRDGKLSLNELELKKQLRSVLAIIAVGGLGDAIARDSCNIVGHPI